MNRVADISLFAEIYLRVKNETAMFPAACIPDDPHIPAKHRRNIEYRGGPFHLSDGMDLESL